MLHGSSPLSLDLAIFVDKEHRVSLYPIGDITESAPWNILHTCNMVAGVILTDSQIIIILL